MVVAVDTIFSFSDPKDGDLLSPGSMSQGLHRSFASHGRTPQSDVTNVQIGTSTMSSNVDLNDLSHVTILG